ncbi:hypothetical protein K0U07_04530 [bacterium]|nr:hypothetical protein [bacterium]
MDVSTHHLPQPTPQVYDPTIPEANLITTATHTSELPEVPYASDSQKENQLFRRFQSAQRLRN